MLVPGISLLRPQILSKARQTSQIRNFHQLADCCRFVFKLHKETPMTSEAFSVATRVQYSEARGPVHVYTGEVHPRWTVNAVPHGGYVLALIVGACVQFQASSSQPDPLHLTAYYLRTTSVGPFEVHIRSVRTGKTLSNLTADLVQNGETKVTTQLVFGNLSLDAASASSIPMTLVPPSPLARRTPFTTHPGPCLGIRPGSRLRFCSYLASAPDPTIRARHNRQRDAGDGIGGVEHGLWYAFTDPADTLTPAALAFFADLFINTLPASIHPDLGKCWFPTVVLSIDFKSPLPCDLHVQKRISKRTVGVMSASRFMNEPLGRHDITVEVWTAPSDIGDGQEVREGWRDKQRCLLVAHQMALMMPMEVNLRQSTKGTDTKSKL